MHPRLTDADVDKVIQKIKAFDIVNVKKVNSYSWCWVYGFERWISSFKKGYNVTIIEQLSHPGGIGSEIMTVVIDMKWVHTFSIVQTKKSWKI